MATVAPPELTVDERALIVQTISENYTQGGLTVFNFSAVDIAEYFNFPADLSRRMPGTPGIVGVAQAEALQRQVLGLPQTPATQLATLLLDPGRLKPGATSPNQGYGDIVWGLGHLSRHPKGSRYKGDFNIGTFVSNFVGVLTFGTAPDLTSFFSKLGRGELRVDKIQFNVPFTGAHVNKLAHDWVGFYTGQQLSDEATPILDSDVARLLQSIAGGVAGAIVGAGVTSTLTGVGAPAQAAATSTQVVGVTHPSLLQPATSFFPLNFAQAGVPVSGVLAPAGTSAGGGFFAGLGSTLMTGVKFVGGAVVAGYVQKFISGGQKALQQLVRGDFDEAVKTIVETVKPDPSTGGNAPRPGASIVSGGGGGGSYGSGAGVQSSSLISTLLPIGLLVGVIALLIYLYKRKH